MIIDICIVKATRSQKPAPNHCALCDGELPVASVATKTIATATSASAKASGNQRSNQSDRRRPIPASVECERRGVDLGHRRANISEIYSAGQAAAGPYVHVRK